MRQRYARPAFALGAAIVVGMLASPSLALADMDPAAQAMPAAPAPAAKDAMPPASGKDAPKADSTSGMDAPQAGAAPKPDAAPMAADPAKDAPMDAAPAGMPPASADTSGDSPMNGSASTSSAMAEKPAAAGDGMMTEPTPERKPAWAVLGGFAGLNAAIIVFAGVLKRRTL